MIYLSICLYHLKFLSSMSYSFWVQVVYLPGYIYSKVFYLFWCHCKWGYFLYSLSNSLLFVYRNATDFCMLILHPASLLNSTITELNYYFCFSVVSLYYIYNIMSSTKKMTVLLLPNQFWCFLFLFLLEFLCLGYPILC